MAYEAAERRRHQRFDVARAIYIEVEDQDSRSEADNLIIRCETVDVSVGGLRLWVPEPVAPGSRLNIAVPEEEWKENLELVGKVMWSQRADQGDGFWLGLELEDTSRDNMERWFKVVQLLKR